MSSSLATSVYYLVYSPDAGRTSDSQDTMLELDVNVAEEPSTILLFLANTLSAEQRRSVGGGGHREVSS